MPLPYMRAVCVAVAQHPYGSPGTMPMEASRAVVSGPYVDRSGSRYVNPSYASTTGLGRRGTGRGRPTAARRTSDSRPIPQDTTGGIGAGKGLLTPSLPRARARDVARASGPSIERGGRPRDRQRAPDGSPAPPDLALHRIIIGDVAGRSPRPAEAIGARTPFLAGHGLPIRKRAS